MSATLLALLALGANSGAIPAIREEFRQITLVHQALQRYDVAIDVSYEEAKAPLLIHSEVKCIDKFNCLRAIGNLTLLDSVRFSIAIDRSTQTMTVARRNATAPGTTASTPDPDKVLETWLAKGAKVSGGQLTHEGRHWMFQPADATHLAAELYTDPTTHLIRRIIYQARGKDAATTRISVAYSWRDASRLNAEEFAESHYVLDHDDHLEAASSYARYRIIRADRH
jgi:hypothetical protein